MSATALVERPELSRAHAADVAAVTHWLETNAKLGLREDQIAARRSAFGFNQLDEAAPVPLWRKAAAQFQELVVWILLVAAVVSGLVGDWTDTVAIVAIVLLNAGLGLMQEQRAERALQTLKKLSSPVARVIRNGTVSVIPAQDLVPGDILHLEAGDHVSADARLIETSSFATQESTLTGESMPVDKEALVIVAPATVLAERRNMAFMGTLVTAGKASSVVVATGMGTELGRIARLLNRESREPTPLQRRISQLGRILILVCLALVVLFFALELLRGGEILEVLLLSVSLAVAAVPEGLPAVVTICLALGMERMVKRHALVRRLPSVETLGAVTVICSDKTGTLTRNEMTVEHLIVGNRRYRLSGVGYSPQGSIDPVDDGNDPSSGVMERSDLTWALTIGAVCNNARLVSVDDSSAGWQIIGDPTEAALIVAAAKGGVDAELIRGSIIAEKPFDSQRKMMSVIWHDRQRTAQFTKGAPEIILDRCVAELRDGRIQAFAKGRREELAELSAAMASEALRILALAYRDLPDGSEPIKEDQLILAGLVAMRDPPREEVRQAIVQCHAAGIRPVMITGDHPATARAVANELGLQTGDQQALTGSELDKLSDEQLAGRVREIAVYARVSAEHKLRIVDAWKTHDEIVAMTGDGVNDAPAVKAAQVGIAMGITGTDVTKEAADIVLTDDNFASIVNAVEEGRSIYDNIRKIVHYLLSCNAGEVLFMLWAAVAGWPLPLVAIQILWINLITDGLPALALAMEPSSPDTMQRPPRPVREPVISARQGMKMLVHGGLIATATAIGFALVYQGGRGSLDQARTTAFCILAASQLFYSFTCRSSHRSLPQLGVFSNSSLLGAIVLSGLLQVAIISVPAARSIFEVTGTLGLDWWKVLGLSLLPATGAELAKLIHQAYLCYQGATPCHNP